MKEARNKVIEEGPQLIEWHAKAKDGHLFWAEANIRHLPFGKRDYLVVRVRDIAARKQREAALQSAKDFAENLLKTANAMVVRLDVAGNIQIFNEAAEAITGYATAEMLGRNWFEVLVPKNRFPHVKEEFQRLMAGGLPKRFENPILTKFGEERFIVWRNNEIREQGQIVGTISFGVDITEHRQAEKALQESEARNRALLTAIPDILFLVNNEGVLLDFHSNGLPNLFIPLEDHINRPIQNVLPSPLGEQIVAACNRALETGVMQQIEYRMQGDSPVEYVEARVVKSSEKTVFVMLRDITEGRKLQEQLMVSDRMASVGTLAAGVAHEINNPLAAILANIELVISKFTKLALPIPDEEVREIRDDLGDALDAAIRVKHIVNDLRIFSRAQEVRDGPVDIERLLESSLRMAYNEIRHRAKVVRDFQPVPPVNGNESRLGQVLLNVIVNAAQAIDEGHAEANEIRVATRTDESGRVVIEISDTGAGMPPEMVRKLFTPFFTTKPVGVGTGLGLVICHRIVDALGGSIEVESTIGKGSTFRILLPPGQEEDFAPSTLVWDRQIAPPYQGKVLIVDDEYMLGRVLGRTLGGEHQVTIVTRAQEALKKISAGERFDAILCDLMMPEMSGMEFYNEVSQVASDQARQIIFMTGGAFTPRARAFLEEVPNARLQKPFELTTLKNLINMQLNETSSHESHPRV
jgi:PAS domain S-box-containing protein